MKNTIKKIWRDPVLSKIIAISIVWCVSNIGLLIPFWRNFVNRLSTHYLNRPFLHISLIFILFLVILTVTLLLLRNWRRMKKQRRNHDNLMKLTGEKISISQLNESFEGINKLSIIGIASVGKTTLIENLCEIENKLIITQGTGAYIRNFSRTTYKYAALLDGSGQSQSEQNDLALMSEFLVLVIDHNDSHETISIDKTRLQDHGRFLDLLIDRLKTSNHKPKWIHLILNKSDLWKKLSTKDQEKLNSFFADLKNKLSKEMRSSLITSASHSNKNISDRKVIMKKILENIT